MKRIVFCIPSRDRCDNQKAVKYLRSIGIPKSDIYVCVQTEEDYAAYSEKWSDEANVVFRKSEGVAANRNFALTIEPDAYQLQIDDVVSHIIVKTGKGKAAKIKTRDELVKVFSRCIDYAIANGASMFIFNSSGNPLYLSDTECINHPICIVSCMFLDRSVKFDERMYYHEDTERTLRVIGSGGKSIRFDNIGPVRERNNVPGGCSKYRGMKTLFGEAVAKAYPKYIKIDKNGKLYVDKRLYQRRPASIIFKDIFE